MARQLDIKVVVDKQQAQADLAQIDQAVQKVDQSATSAGTTGIPKLEQALDRTIKQATGATSGLTKIEGAAMSAQQAAARAALGLDSVAVSATAVEGAAVSAAGGLGIVAMASTAVAAGAALGLAVLAKSLIEDAAALTRLAQQTGITVEGLQRLRVAAGEAKVSFTDTTSAIEIMRKRFDASTPAFQAGLRELGISAQAFKTLDLEHQFIAISDAVRTVADPIDRVRIAHALLGEKTDEVLPLLLRGFDDVKDRVVEMSEETVRRLAAMSGAYDDLKNHIGSWWRSAKGYLADYIASTNLAEIASQWMNRNRIDDMARTPLPLPGAGGLNLPTITVNERFENTITDAALGRIRDAAREAEKATEHLRKLAQAVEEVGFKAKPTGLSLEVLNKAIKLLPVDAPIVKTLTDEIERLSNLAQPVDSFNVAMRKLWATFLAAPDVKELSLTEILQRIHDLETIAPKAAYQTMTLVEALDQLGKPEVPTLTPLVTTAEKIQRSFAGIAQILDQVRGKFAEIARIGLNAGEAIAKALFPKGDLPKDVFGAVIAGATAAIAVVSKLWDSLTGGEAKRTNRMRDADVFLKSLGKNIDEISAKAARAGFDLKKVLDASTVKTYTAAIEELKDAINFQNSALDELSAAEEKYHLSLDTTAAAVFREYKILTAAGRDSDVVLQAMKGSWQDIVTNALKFGITLPAQLKPIIERMIALGIVTDQDGTLLTDITRLNFAPMGDSGKSAFDRITTAVDRLVAAIKLHFGIALDDVERRILGLPDIVRRTVDDIANQPVGGGPGSNPDNPQPTNPDNPGLVAGGFGLRSRPSSSTSIVINNPVVRSDRDIREITRQVSEALSESVRLRAPLGAR